jgi:hypothetical protein
VTRRSLPEVTRDVMMDQRGLVRTIVIAVFFAMLTRPADAQLPTISAARAAASVAASDGAVDTRTVKYVAGGAALGAVAGIAVGAVFYTLFPDTCTVTSETPPCGSPNFVRWGVLGAVAGAVSGAYMASRQRENVNSASLRVSPLPGTNGLALRILFR